VSTPALRGGLTLRTVLASGLLALVVGAAFAILLVAIVDQRGSRELALHSRTELSAADGLLKLLIEVETGQRGFVITRKERFLEPWRAARTALPERARRLARYADDPGQARRAREIARVSTSYIRDYSVPLVNAARRGEASARSVAATEEGKRRVDALRGRFDRFRTVERDLLEARQDRVDADGRRAIVVAAAGVVGSTLLIVLFGVYLARGIGRPVRRAAVMAGRLAGGDLTVRMPETGPAEVGELERAFNTMAGSLEASRVELTRLLEEQAALRRVATLVAQAVSPPEVFESVTREVGLLSGADLARMERYESDGKVTGVAGWARDRDHELAVGTRFALEGVSIAALVRQMRGAARVDSFVHASGPIAQEARALGIRSSVGCPIVVEGKLWGVIAASSRSEGAFPPDTESQIAAFTELVATAIANAESRAEVTASRARVVAAADESRRRIERDLHDGAQQRLVTLALELREAEAAVPPELHELRERLAETAKGVAGVLEDLQEISRGIHPAILSEGGLGPALKTLARRSSVPVELDLGADRRLPERVEVAAYFVASEALTNAAKHAQASVVHVHFEARDGIARLAIRDDGVGGANAGHGSGLIGLTDRVEAIGGTIEVTSPAGSGTSLLVEFPIDGS
jgi:signal transduction histidine kinase